MQHRIPRLWRNIALLLLLIIALISLAEARRLMVPPRIYWGALIKGESYGLNDAPWNTQTIDIFETNAQKRLAILHWGQPWWGCYSQCGYQPFAYQREQFDLVRSRGYIPLLDWASFDYTVEPEHEQPQFALSTIIEGEHDAYIRSWATEARDWGHPFFLRFNWEMNGDWFPWSEKVNGNSSGEFVQAWRHVHDIFREVGAQNVTWVWCPVTYYPGGIPLETLYPGDEYVDWSCMDGYNSGTNPERPDRWRSFAQVFEPTYTRLRELAPEKPIMIAEFASSEYGGSKANWIDDALSQQLPHFFPQIQAIVWFNWNNRGVDWIIESSAESQQAFADAIGNEYYAANEFAELTAAPIPPLRELDQQRYCIFC